jgi:hypothetical protein
MPAPDASSVVTTYVKAWTAGWFRLRDGKIAAIRASFDARPLDPAR